ncbi:MAG: transglycosylase domain-containing protein [Leptolyngbyaceae bacterium]|nr:transglycosylase domain-containing protein [Leptolyngbyaceae bacterium]
MWHRLRRELGHQRWKHPLWRASLALLLLGLGVRSLPYLAPIHATDLVQDQQAIAFTDRNGLPLGTLLTRDQNHTAVVSLAQISPYFIQAILAAEDGRFYQHGVLEGRAIVRSTLEALRAGEFRSGASTITMQLARMLDPVPMNLWGKVQEIWLAWRLAAGMTKDEILHAYINRLPMGGNIYGVEAAARSYFGLPAADLNIAQASLLAALPNNPTYLNPYDYWEPMKVRQAYVLNRMVKDGYITQSQADRAYGEAIALQSRQQGIIAAPHFLFWLASQLPQSHAAQVQTTLDRSLQQFAEAQVQQVLRTLAPHNVHHAAALVIDNHSGEILAYVGSPDYFSEAQGGRNDGVQALRQPGSTLKPFLYQLALENRTIRPNTVLADVPTYYAIPGAKLYSPTDYTETFQGPVRVRIALANSLNIPAVRVLEQVGVQAFLDRLHQLGFEHLTQSPEHYGLGLSLGSGEVSLWELARAYVTLARQGQAVPLVTHFADPSSKSLSGDSPEIPPTPLTKGGNNTWKPPFFLAQRRDSAGGRGGSLPMPATSQASLQQAPNQNPKSEALLITDMLSDRHARAKAFGVNSILNLPFPAAVKTGTSSDFRDTWTVGFTSDYTVATWVGNFNGDPMRQVSGVVGAAPLWNRIMLHLHEQQEPTAFPAPPDLVQRPICALSGLRPTSACPTVVQEYFYTQDLSDYERQVDTFYQLTSQGTGKTPQPRLNLPAEYNEWLAMQPQTPLATGDLRILAPRKGDFFLLPSAGSEASTPGVAQQLEFKLAAPPELPVEWWLNDQKLATQSSTSLFWTLRPGNWTLRVQSGEMSDRVTFQVQLSDRKPHRRGFSWKE